MNEFYVDLAKRAYHEYGKTTDFKNFAGGDMPAFDSLPDKIKLAWHNAARHVFNAGQAHQAFKHPSCGSCAG